MHTIDPEGGPERRGVFKTLSVLVVAVLIPFIHPLFLCGLGVFGSQLAGIQIAVVEFMPECLDGRLLKRVPTIDTIWAALDQVSDYLCVAHE